MGKYANGFFLVSEKIDRNSPFIVTYSDIFEINALEELLKSEEDVKILYDLNWQKLWENRFSNFEDAETFKVDNEVFF